MIDPLDGVLRSGRGAVGRSDALTVCTRGQLDAAVRAGRLVALFPRAYCRPWDLDDADVRDRAALLSVGQPAVISHRSAVRRWGLPVPAEPAVHVATSRDRHPGGGPAAGVGRGRLVVHRPRAPLRSARAGGVATAPLADAIVSTWPQLTGSEQRAPALAAVRNRLVTVEQLRARIPDRMTGRAALTRLVDLLAAGCESELELWGDLQVFDVPGLRHAVRQRVVTVDGRRYRLDLAYEREKVAVELDGRAYHAGAGDWERDIRRDLALATHGWQTVRLSHRRLTTDVAGCRRDVLAVLAARRAGSARS